MYIVANELNELILLLFKYPYEPHKFAYTNLFEFKIQQKKVIVL